ncbi:hypothetical protein SAMN06298212_1292 [Ruaniaceae bacterium KH17]|nr:hypothetical protein SAMN06298212_1292 [Ruaniaceae bacterium KH17]
MRAEIGEDDMGVREFARILDRLEPVLPISQGLTYALGGGSPDASHYAHERDHMTQWFRSQESNGRGAYTRDTPNASAKRTYNRLLNPISVLWIAEALGEDEGVLRQASAAAQAESNYRSRPATVRKYVPWSRVYELALPLRPVPLPGKSRI